MSICSMSILLIASVIFLFSNYVMGIECFKCVSENGRNRACDDPFHNNYTVDILESPCLGGRKGRNGLFPATACIKLNGVYGRWSSHHTNRGFIGFTGNASLWVDITDDTGESLTIRGCALDSGTLTTDTEIIRMSHCGGFYFEDRYLRGCLQSCADADACNFSTRKFQTSLQTLLICFFHFIFSNI